MNATVTVQETSRSLTYRVAVFAYGIAAYLIGVSALLALMLIMLGVFHFTGGPAGQLGLGAGLALDFLLLAAFALQHSVMARTRFKARWTRIIPAAAERSTYVRQPGWPWPRCWCSGSPCWPSSGRWTHRCFDGYCSARLWPDGPT